MFGRSSRSQSQTLLDGKPAVFNENVANKGVTTRSSRPALKELTNQNQIPKIKDDKKEADKKTSVLAPHNPTAIPKQTSVVPAKQTAIAPSNKDVFAHPNNVSKQENKPQPPQAKIPEDIDVEDLESGSDEEENSEEEETQEQFDAMDIEALGDGTNLEVYEENSMDEEAPPILDASVEDIDSCDIDDPQFCSEYVHLVFKYLRKVEEKLKPDSNYMEKQKDVSEKHRAVLVDWLVEVGSNFKLLTETMFLTIHILDRFLSVKSVTRSKLQLVGMTAMLIASKIEEIYTPQVKDFVCICASAYDASEILTTEKQMLIALGFNLNAAHALHFLRRFSKAGHADSKTHTLAKYIIELSLLEYKMLQYLPSKIAASAVYISRKMCNIKPLWNKTLSYHAGYTESEIMDCIIDLNEIVRKQSPDGKTKSVYKKYASSKFLSVALIPSVSI